MRPAPENLRRYGSSWRAAVRRPLQRGILRALVRTAVTQKVWVHPQVRSVRGEFLLVANHSSHLDAPMLAQGLPYPQARLLATGVAADYFFHVWHRRYFVQWLFNAFPIDRDGSSKNLGTAVRLLAGGVPILLFPEGTRQTTGEIAPFTPGAAKLAKKLEVTVIPAAIIGGHQAMPKGRSWPLKGRPPVGVIFGEPLRVRPGESTADFSARIHRRVVGLYHEHYEDVMGQPPPGEKEIV